MASAEWVRVPMVQSHTPRVQQSTMACSYTQPYAAVYTNADIHVPQLVGSRHPKEPGPAPTAGAAGRLQQFAGSHDPLSPLAIHRLTKLTAGHRSDHPGAIGRVRSGDLNDRFVTRSTRAITEGSYPSAVNLGAWATRLSLVSSPPHCRPPTADRATGSGGSQRSRTHGTRHRPCSPRAAQPARSRP